MYTDEELTKRASGIREEQDRWNDLFATKLIEVLDKIDGIRGEVRADLTSVKRMLPGLEELELSISRSKREADAIERLRKMQEGHFEEQRQLTESLKALSGESGIAKADLLSAVASSVSAKHDLNTAASEMKNATLRFEESRKKLVEARRSLGFAEESTARLESVLREAHQELVLSAQRLDLAETTQRIAETDYRRLKRVNRKAAHISLVLNTIVFCCMTYVMYTNRPTVWLSIPIAVGLLSVPTFFFRLSRREADDEK